MYYSNQKTGWKLNGTGLLLILALFLFSNFSFAKTYYISNSGSDSNSGTSQSAPWQTLNKLYNSWNQISAGDSILLKRGDTFAPSSISDKGVIQIPNGKTGTASKYIVIGAYGSGSKPVVTNKNISKYSWGLYARSLAYFIIQDIKFNGGVYFYVGDSNDLGVHHIKLLRLEIEGTRLVFLNPYQPANTPAPNVAKPLHHIEVGYTIFRNNTGEDAFNMAETQGFNWIHHNEFYNVEEEAFDMGGGDSSIVEYNLISGTTQNGLKLHSQFMWQTNTIVRGNLVMIGSTNTAYPLAFECVKGGKVYNNTFIGGTYSAFLGWLHANPPLQSDPKNNALDMSNNEFSNNIFYGTMIIGVAKGVNYTYRNGTKATINQDDIWNDNYFNNNQFYSTKDSKKIRVFNFTGSITYDASVEPYGRYKSSLTQKEINITESNFQTEWASRPNVSNDRYGDPGFVNPVWSSATSYGDYHLKSSSASIGTGKAIAEYRYDLDGKTVAQGVALDRGVYQTNTTTSGQKDVTAPVLKGAEYKDSRTIILSFNEALERASAGNISAYSINGGISVSGAVLSSDGMKVTLTTSDHVPGANYTITVNRVKDLAGNIISSSTASYYVDTATDVEETNMPKEYELSQNYPNPFNPSTKIKFSLPAATNLKLTVFNALGEAIKELANGDFREGVHEFEFNAAGMASGIYYYRIETPAFTQTRKMVYMK